MAKAPVKITNSQQTQSAAVSLEDLDSVLQHLDSAINQGAATAVYPIINMPTMVLKEILLDRLPSTVLPSLNSIQDVLPRLRHPNILSYKKVAKRDSNFYLLMARYPSSLDSFIRTHRRQKQAVPTAMLIDVARQVAAGLAYLHDPNKKDADGKPLPSLVHGRVKPANILVNEDGTQFVLSDAGVCTEDAHGGVKAYTAPEVRAGAAPTPASDMWSLGAVIYELATGKKLLEGKQASLNSIEEPAIRDLLQRILVLEPERRISARELAEISDCKEKVIVAKYSLKTEMPKTPVHDFNSMHERILRLEESVQRIHQLEASLNSVQEIIYSLTSELPTSTTCTSQKTLSQSLANSLTPLMKAARDGDIETVRELINTGNGISEKDKTGKTALMYATKRGHLDIVKLLMQYEARKQDSQGRTALMHATQSGHVDVVKILLNQEKRMQRKDGKTALMIAAENGYIDVAKALLKHEKRKKSSYGFSALMIAAQNGHVDVVKLLVDHEKEMKNKKGSTALMLAAEKGHTDVVDVLANHEKGIRDSDGRTALTHARQYNRQDIIDILSQYPEERA